MKYKWTAETLLGPIKCEGDVVDFLTRDMSKADCKELMLIGLLYRYKFRDNSKKRSRRGRPIKLNSIDSERAAIILNLVKWQKRSMPIRKWVDLAQQCEAILKTLGDKRGKTLLPDGKSYFPKTLITAKRLENSVCQGMKELGVNFRLYQKNPEEYPEI